MNNVIRAIGCVLIVAILALGVHAWVNGQYVSNPNKQQDPMAKSTATLTATLVDAEKKAAQKAATVEVKVSGIKLIDPGTVNEMAKAGQGHLHYQVDDGPVIATPATKLSFHGLTSGEHKIVVVLAGNDHNPLGPQQTLTVKIP